MAALSSPTLSNTQPQTHPPPSNVVETSSSPPTGSCLWPCVSLALDNSPCEPCSRSNPPPSPAANTPNSSSRVRPPSANPSSTASTPTTSSWRSLPSTTSASASTLS